MVESLERIDGNMPMAVLTNKPTAATDRILAGLGLSRFFIIAIGGDAPYGRKPGPAGLLHIAASAGVAPGETLLVGDSPIDLQTARRAGTMICLARYGFGYRFANADFLGDERFVDRPADIPAVIAESAAAR